MVPTSTCRVFCRCSLQFNQFWGQIRVVLVILNKGWNVTHKQQLSSTLELNKKGSAQPQSPIIYKNKNLPLGMYWALLILGYQNRLPQKAATRHSKHAEGYSTISIYLKQTYSLAKANNTFCKTENVKRHSCLWICSKTTTKIEYVSNLGRNGQNA